MTALYQGLFTALITPFQADGDVDWPALDRLLDIQISHGIGIVIHGTTGESPTLTHGEKLDIAHRAIARAKGKVPVIMGVGSNNTAESVALAKEAATAKADGVMAVTPYYNKPSQEGLYRHFCAIAEATALPLLLYNIKGRSAVNIEVSTILRLAHHPNIMGVKEASADLDQFMRILAEAPADFAVLSGDDSWALPVIALGGKGLVSVIANLRPAETKAIVDAALQGNIKTAQAAHRALYPLMQAMFMETNPVPLKTAMAAEGMITESFRLPMCSMTAEAKQKLLVLLANHKKKIAA